MDTSNPLPFSTTDAILALCLRMAGVPMWLPPMNVYTVDILDRLGYTGRGLTLRQAAVEADKNKARGRIEYWFTKTPELPDLLKIYHDQENEIKSEDKDVDAGERIREIMSKATNVPDDGSEQMDEREALIRLFCIALKMFVPFKNQYKEWTSFLEIQKNGRDPEQVGPNTTRYFPGLNRVPVNASDSMLKKLKLL